MCRFTILMVLACSFLLSKAENSQSRIVDGSPAKPDQFPWQAGIKIRRLSGTTICGGSLIDKEWVLTAAHCVIGAVSFTVYLGGLTLEPHENGTRIAVAATRYIEHPNYNAEHKHYDIALIQLDRPVSFNKNIKPIEMAEPNLKIPGGVTVAISGWGGSSSGSSKFLMYTYLTTITNQKCIKTYGSQAILASSLCAVGKPNHSTCGSDSGGPVVIYRSKKPVLVAVSSYEHKSGCGLGHPAVFVRVAPFRRWIEEYIITEINES